jgi:hypothetical protein
MSIKKDGSVEEFFRSLPERTDSEQNWMVTCKEIEVHKYDLKAVNPNSQHGRHPHTGRIARGWRSSPACAQAEDARKCEDLFQNQLRTTGDLAWLISRN